LEKTIQVGSLIRVELTLAGLAWGRLPVSLDFEVFADGCAFTIRVVGNGMNTPALRMQVFGLLTDLLALSQPFL
jgi:hypothetical protein